MMDPKQREKCLKEVRLLESLDHPNIIKYLDSFIESNQLFISIEWAEKGDLKKLIKKHQADELPIDEKKIWEYLYQIASALKHMQEKRIMHRDLKPANIFLVSDGSLKLGDLGLGRFMSSQTIEAFSRVGTPLYMSPEVLKGSGYDWKSDVWSLGCIVYELACFRSPFKKEDEKMSLYDLFQTISKGEFPPLPDRYSEELKQVVASMIQIAPQSRLAIDQVVELCEIQLKANVKKHRIDPFLIMDDIAEKLKLLDYEQNFCKLTNRKPFNRVYFAKEFDKTEQLRCFFDLCNWITSLRNPSQHPVFLGVRTDPDRIVTTILTNCRNLEVKLPDFVTGENLKVGFGEAVCFIVNDLLNKELIRQDYRFETPVLIENGVECYGDPPEVFEFFDEMPSGDKEMLMEKEKIEKNEEEIIEEPEEIEEKGLIDPVEWYKEVERVNGKLLISDEDIGKIGACRVLQDLMQKLTEANQSFLFKGLIARMDKIGENLERIKQGEKRIQREFSNEIEGVKEVLDVARAMKRPEKRKESNSKRAEFYYTKKEKVEALSQKLAKIEENFGKLSEKKVQSSPLPELKSKLLQLKKDLRNLDLTLGIMRHKHDEYLYHSHT